jgi:hypothetical protein
MTVPRQRNLGGYPEDPRTCACCHYTEPWSWRYPRDVEWVHLHGQWYCLPCVKMEPYV